jgi:hypothetical protein
MKLCRSLNNGRERKVLSEGLIDLVPFAWTGGTVTENGTNKQFGLIDRWKEASGIYGLGFERESFLGFMLPWVIVFGVGGLLGAIIYFWL